MRNIRIIASATFMTAALVGPAGAGGNATDGDGRMLAERLCSRCHAVGASGDSPLAPAPPFRTIADKYPLENLEEALAEGISVGHEAMPEFEFTPEQIDSFLAYLKTL